MHYTQLSEDYKYETIADAIYGREVEYFHYEFDKTNFEYLLTTADDAYRADLQTRIGDIIKQMAVVEGVIAALKSQILDTNAYEQAVQRMKERRDVHSSK